MRQYLLATTPNGRTHRWAEDEPTADRVIEGLQDSDTVPGGDEALSVDLARKPGVDYSDLQNGTHIELFGVGGYKVWGGRLEREPRTSGDRLAIEPAAVGYRAALADDESAQWIPIDSDLGSWGEPSALRRREVPANKYNVNAAVQTLPAGDPKGGDVAAISHSWSEINNDGNTHPDVAESWYDGLGIPLGRIMLDFLKVKGMEGTDWADQVFSSEDGATLKEELADFNATSASAQDFDIAPERLFLMLRDVFAAAWAGSGNWEAQWRNVKVMSRHGLPLYGAWPAVGLLASDVIAYSLSRWCPRIRFTTGPGGSIRPSFFPIPHLTFKEQTTVGAMVEQALRYEPLEWGVWDGQLGPTFYLNGRGEREGRKRWRGRVGPAQLQETGQQIDRAWNSVVVLYPDSDGSIKQVGPPGSGCRVTDDRLLDLDPLNPANLAGLRRCKKIQLKDVSTAGGAIEAGQRFLEGVKLLDGSGQATLTGYVEDEHGARWPYYYVKSGDLFDPIDASVSGYRYIVKAGRARQGRGVTINLDAPPDDYEAMLERIGAEEVRVGLSA